MIFKLCDEAVKEIEKQKKDIAVPIVSGGLTTLEAYKYDCGRIQGLNIAIAVIKDFVKKLHEED
jgi:hypothetical protein